MTRIATEHPIVIWMCDHAGYLLNRLEVGRDGKTAYERMKGKRSKVLGLEFAEKVLWRGRPNGPTMKKIEPQWQHDVYIGVKRTSGEIYIACEDRSVKLARTVRRVPESEKWKTENLDWVMHVPWNMGTADKEADGDAT